MTTVAVSFVVLLLCHLGVLAGVLAGEMATAVPLPGLVCVLVVARRSTPGRVRIVALAAGLVTGSLFEGGLLLVPVIYLFCGTLARSTRLLVSLDTWWQLCGLGVLFAALEAVCLGLVVGLPPSSVGSVPLPMIGVLLTGMAFALAELLILRSPRLCHAIERP